MNHTFKAAGAALALGLCSVALAPLASAVGGADYFVVNTTGRGPSEVTDAGGVFDSCTSVRDLSGSATATGANRLVFSGEKRVSCDDGRFTLTYEAATAGNSQTVGTWTITASSLAGAEVGDSGTLRGDYSSCEPAGACILDTFTLTG